VIINTYFKSERAIRPALEKRTSAFGERIVVRHREVGYHGADFVLKRCCKSYDFRFIWNDSRRYNVYLFASVLRECPVRDVNHILREGGDLWERHQALMEQPCGKYYFLLV
ncbi:hypothetical protein ALC53_03321, partial [Atta colombica]